ncbi:endonuclease/exonuclease/phosphatase family protein [uncultured Eudoraea sp.]|uniref:endonuclease/exonuclease/phosphatase family protein n=1 Tax=uncultured Eudoraea sp. TaxID=1035614 RepID=UPI0026143BFF|nr:endonuclease/exonuclease/phosphatase family protein [uncultured Eudoraea sp.]
MLFSFLKRNKLKNIHTIAFYNLENLFDIGDDPNTLDKDFTPKGKKKWTKRRYKKKLLKLANTISGIGLKNSNRPPVLVGIAEVENEKVIKDLISSGALKNEDYGYVHYNSPDERGIDTALLYLKSNFNILYSTPIPLLIYNPEGERDTTRDILYVHGLLNGEEIHVFVNHWPSRRDGELDTEYKRIKAAGIISDYMSQIEKNYSNPNYVVMGDFNDGPDAQSIRNLVESKSLYNPMEKLWTPERGSANYRRSWSLFDQILVSHSFFNYAAGTHSFAYANIFDDHQLKEWGGKYAGNPFRTYVGQKYKGGYSDHFPVYIQLKFN